MEKEIKRHDYSKTLFKPLAQAIANLTEEKRIEMAERQKQIEDARAENRRRKSNRRFKIDEKTVDVGRNEEIDLFGSTENIDNMFSMDNDIEDLFSESNNLVNSDNDDDDINLL